MTSAVAVMAAEDARVLTDRIKVGVEAVWELITRAYTERAWDALGYSSWDDYCTREFGTTRLRLPREERAEVVASLRESGLSIRAIASATNEPVMTVQNELARVRSRTPEPDVEPDQLADDLIVAEQHLPPLPENYMNIPGGVTPSTPGQTDRMAEALAKAGSAAPVADPPKPVTGLDGKKYQPARPAPKPSQEPATPRRRPLTDAAREIGLDLKNLTSRMERLLADDRFARNKDEVAPHLRHYLVEAIKVCQDLNHQINP
ncbi:hypothetical protein [Mycobacterium sp. 23]|uniref:hypothetical protein n=1 Tax=Mycobacterium sp. 23 TaxID=3400424 RepID=UPI003AAB36D7